MVTINQIVMTHGSQPNQPQSSEKLSLLLRPFQELRSRVRSALDERQVNKWKNQLDTFEPGCVRLDRWDELYDLSEAIANREETARIELVRRQLEILIEHVQNWGHFWAESAIERLKEVSVKISQLEALNTESRPAPEIHRLAQELTRLVAGTLRNSNNDLMN